MIMMLATLTISLNAASEEKVMMETKTAALGGYCPVCYIAAGKANMGDPKITSKLDGKTYQFVSNETKAMFDKEPAKYLPQYDGFCAYGMSLGKKFESDPTVFKVVEGKIYLNKSAKIGKLFSKNTAADIVKADKEWKKMEMKKAEMKHK